ncbi:MAG: bifunctional glutamate N-acetyltransferase/amino-acid acetyltransferase ArgJ [Anaerolineae bacterium]|nr:bifunctional glutamate N-acetyltransferase/amino-acid acetyltransferase ArgJ [Anaerolineae bacterium]
MTAKVQGFQSAGVHCGLKAEGAKDLALIVSDRPCAVAGVFTTNQVKAAPVIYDQSILAAGNPVRAVVTNTGKANACTGEQGLVDTRSTAEHAAQVIGCSLDEVLVLSTGVIGVNLPMDIILPGIERAAAALSPDGWEDASSAIMTTDTRPKLVSVTTESGYTITGIAKGAGMIAPNMATMLSVVVTDAVVSREECDRVLRQAVGESFNRIVVDGDMSTNDTLLLLANGASGVEIAPGDEAFAAAVREVCTELAQAIVRDGEGATKFVTLEVTGAPGEDAAVAVARTVALSPLCKTAFYGGDPNWGRIVCAAGYAGVPLDCGKLSLWLLDAAGEPVIQLVDSGCPADYDEPSAIALMQQPEWGLRLDLGLGAAQTVVWTCDLSHEYVTINGHYRT